MSANYFYIIVAALLLGIYIFFKPMHIKQNNPKEVAQLELENFTVYELDTSGVKSIMKGSTGKRFTNRNEAFDIDFTDNTKLFTQNMKADFGRQKAGVIYLKGNVRYQRKDGLRFTSQEAKYNQKTKVATTDDVFSMYYGDNWVHGKKLYYQTSKRLAKAEHIDGTYEIEKER